MLVGVARFLIKLEALILEWVLRALAWLLFLNLCWLLRPGCWLALVWLERCGLSQKLVLNTGGEKAK